jgi:steroid 5-alpha reductase family enzyme
MNTVALFTNAGIAILILMAALWLASLALRNSSIVDIFWGAGFILVTWIIYFSVQNFLETYSRVAVRLSPHYFYRFYLLIGLVTLWGLRLSFHILRRNWDKPEDFRYAKWRADHGPHWWWISFFQVFLLQGVLMWIVAAPVIAGLLPWPRTYPPLPDSVYRLVWFNLAGAVVWVVGFFFEAVGDRQLARFKADPANRRKLLTTGLWKYTRHPNYFGDAVQWWGFWLIACAGGAWWTVFSPLLMTFLLLRVSGMSLLEKTLKETKPGFKEYARKTSAFFPWPPKQ